MERDDNFKKIQKYTAFCRKNGISELKLDTGDLLEIKLSERALFPIAKKELKRLEAEARKQSVNLASKADELLFYSVDTSVFNGSVQ